MVQGWTHIFIHRAIGSVQTLAEVSGFFKKVIRV